MPDSIVLDAPRLMLGPHLTTKALNKDVRCPEVLVGGKAHHFELVLIVGLNPPDPCRVGREQLRHVFCTELVEPALRKQEVAEPRALRLRDRFPEEVLGT